MIHLFRSLLLVLGLLVAVQAYSAIPDVEADDYHYFKCRSDKETLVSVDLRLYPRGDGSELITTSLAFNDGRVVDYDLYLLKRGDFDLMLLKEIVLIESIHGLNTQSSVLLVLENETKTGRISIDGSVHHLTCQKML